MIRDAGKIPIKMYRQILKRSVFPSGMRRLLVDVAVYSWFTGTLSDQPGEAAYADFFRDVAVGAMDRMNAAQARMSAGQPPLIAPYDRPWLGCFYHDHDGTGQICYKEMFGHCQENSPTATPATSTS